MKDNFKIHALYIIGILTILVIILFSSRFYDIPKAAELISFAATVASCLLAVIAIVYAFVANLASSNSLSNLDEASKKISDTAEIISTAANDLSSKIEVIPTRLETMHDEFKGLKSKLDLLQLPEVKPLSNKEKEALTEVIELLIERCSSQTWTVIYACYQSEVHDKMMAIPKIFLDENVIKPFYALGVISMLRALGLAEVKFGNAEYLISIKILNAKLSEAVQNNYHEILQKKLNSINKKNLKRQQALKEDFNEINRIIDAFFLDN